MKNLVEPLKDKKQIEAVEKYLEIRNKRNRLIWAFGCNVGLRVSDILALNIEDVKDKNYIEIIEKKTKKHKGFPLNSKLKRLIKDYLDNDRCKVYAIGDVEPLFVGKKHHRLDRSQVYRFINEACKELGIGENVGTHTMRKNFGYHVFKQSGNNIALIQKLFQHSSPVVTLRYIGIDKEEIDKTYENFEL